MILFFFVLLSLSLGATIMLLSVCPPWTWTVTPCLPHMDLKLSQMRYYNMPFSSRVFGWRGLLLLPWFLLILLVVAKELARILKPLVCKTILHVNNTKEFADEVRNTKLEEGEYITSYDVTALFTAVPVPSAVEITKNRLEQDTDIPNRSLMSANNIIELLGFCLNNTYILFQDQFLAQTKGAAMGSPVSPIVANIYMEAFENRAISTTLHPLGYGGGMLMIPLWCNISHIRRNSSGTSTQWILPSSSLWRNPRKMVPYPFWILPQHLSEMEPLL